MKEATGEVSNTVITVVILALLVGLGAYIFRQDGPAQKWIDNIFSKTSNTQVCTKYDASGKCVEYK